MSNKQAKWDLSKIKFGNPQDAHRIDGNHKAIHKSYANPDSIVGKTPHPDWVICEGPNYVPRKYTIVFGRIYIYPASNDDLDAFAAKLPTRPSRMILWFNPYYVVHSSNLKSATSPWRIIHYKHLYEELLPNYQVKGNIVEPPHMIYEFLPDAVVMTEYGNVVHRYTLREFLALCNQLDPRVRQKIAYKELVKSGLLNFSVKLNKKKSTTLTYTDGCWEADELLKLDASCKGSYVISCIPQPTQQQILLCAIHDLLIPALKF